MNILVIGSEDNFKVLQEKLGEQHSYEQVEDVSLALHDFSNQDLVFDFLIDEYPENMEAYKDYPDLKVFLNIPKISLSEMRYYHPEIACTLVGFNGLPGFFENEKWEISVEGKTDVTKIKTLFEDLNQSYFLVQDRVGMVSTRVICMIINEAFYTVQEGTATMEDIDLGMKLGTNYPHGPFEWLKRIGIENVYEVLEALYEDTKEERYKICPILKRAYLNPVK